MRKLLYLFLICLLPSCIQSNVKKVRIVDAQGNPVKINKIIPKFNEEQMEKQKQAFDSSKKSDYNVGTNNVKFVNKNSGIMQQINDPNFISVNNTQDDNVFADRITNFNYVEEVKQNTNEKGNVSGNTDNKNISKDKNSVKKILVQNDIKNNVVEESASNKQATKSNNYKNSSAKGYFIQLGVFNEKSNAEFAYSKYSKISNGIIDNYLSKGKIKYKVSLGPYTDKKLAEKDLEKVIKMGHYDVYITQKK